MPLLVACGDCPPLGDVRVKGSGSDAEESVATATLAEMEQALGPSVCVASLRLAPSPYDGRYNAATRQIRVNTGLDAELLERVVRHEVCHALDLQNDLVAEDPAPYTLPDVEPHGAGDAENEGFALACELGADALRLAWTGQCAEDIDLALSDVRRRAYGLSSGEAVAVFEHLASVDLHALGPPYDEATEATVVASATPGQLVVNAYARGGCCADFQVDALTGEVHLDISGTEDAPVVVHSDPDATPWRHTQGATLPNGTELAVVTLETFAGQLHRMAAWRSGDWNSVVYQACPNRTTAFFVVEDEVWSSQFDDGVLSWGRWSSAGR